MLWEAGRRREEKRRGEERRGEKRREEERREEKRREEERRGEERREEKRREEEGVACTRDLVAIRRHNIEVQHMVRQVDNFTGICDLPHRGVPNQAMPSECRIDQTAHVCELPEQNRRQVIEASCANRQDLRDTKIDV